MSLLEVKLNKDYSHKIMNYFNSIGENEYSYNYYTLRHPGGIYNIRFFSVMSNLSMLIDSLNKKESPDRIYSYFKLLIYDLFKYYESMYEIIQSLCKQHQKPNDNEFLHRWIKKNGYTSGDEFHNKTKNELSYLRNLYNTLKHTSNEICFLYADNGTYRSYGYWLEKAGGNSNVVNEGEPISFNFEIRRIYYTVYKISSIILDCLIKHMKDVHNVVLVEKPINDDQMINDTFIDLYNKINNLPKYFFHSEKDSKYLEPSIINKNDETHLIFSESLISNSILAPYLRKNKNKAFFKGDGFTKSFTFPIMFKNTKTK